MIKSLEDRKALYMKNGKVKFKSYEGVEKKPFIWYITIINNEITLFNNEFYLDFDKNERIAKGFPYMKRWKCERIINNYLIYFENRNNILTINGDKVLIRNEYNQRNQLHLINKMIILRFGGIILTKITINLFINVNVNIIKLIYVCIY